MEYGEMMRSEVFQLCAKSIKHEKSDNKEICLRDRFPQKKLEFTCAHLDDCFRILRNTMTANDMADEDPDDEDMERFLDMVIGKTPRSDVLDAGLFLKLAKLKVELEAGEVNVFTNFKIRTIRGAEEAWGHLRVISDGTVVYRVEKATKDWQGRDAVEVLPSDEKIQVFDAPARDMWKSDLMQKAKNKLQVRVLTYNAIAATLNARCCIVNRILMKCDSMGESSEMTRNTLFVPYDLPNEVHRFQKFRDLEVEDRFRPADFVALQYGILDISNIGMMDE